MNELIRMDKGLVSAVAAVEIDKHRAGGNTDFEAVGEITSLVEKYMARDERRVGGYDVSMPFLYALRNCSDEPILRGPTEEYGLKMRLLYSDLRDIISLGEERLTDLRDFCINLSRQFGAHRTAPKRWIA